MKAVAQKLFNKYGIEITNVFELEYDTELWLSFGEPFKNPFSKWAIRMKISFFNNFYKK